MYIKRDGQESIFCDPAQPSPSTVRPDPTQRKVKQASHGLSVVLWVPGKLRPRILPVI